MVMSATGGGGGAIYNPKAKPSTIDPMEMIQAALAQQGGVAPATAAPSASFQDYMSQATEMYKPQFDYLDQLGNQSKANAGKSSAELKGLYTALANDIYGQAKGIGRNYDAGIKDVNSAYNAGLNSVNGAFDKSMNGTADILARLGIQEAAPNAVGEQGDMKALLSSIMQTNGLASANTLRQGKQSSLAFNTAQGNSAKLQGGEAQAGLKRQLNDFLNQLMGKKADVSTQVNQSAQQMMGQAQTAAQQAAQDAYARFKDERDFNYRMGKDRADLDLKRASMTGDTAKSPKLDPIGEVNKLASGLYGNPQAAQNAVKAVTDAWEQAMQSNQGSASLAQVVAALKERNQHLRNGAGPGDWSNLVRIATQLLGTK